MNRGKRNQQSKQQLLELKRISYNLRSELEAFVTEFVRLDGIKEIMFLIEECQETSDFDLVYVCCGMLATTFTYLCGIEFINKKELKYFEKFLELSSINESIKK